MRLARGVHEPMFMSQRAGTRAAPPDAGGHLGGQTKPSDLLEDPKLEELDQRSPPLHVDPSRNPPRGDATVKRQALYTILLFALLVVMGLFAWLPNFRGVLEH